MAAAYQPGGDRRGVGLAVVVGLHVAAGWAFSSGLAREAVQLVSKPLQVTLVTEVPPPPPPAPPPQKVVQKAAAPKLAPPPPAYVPPPEVTVAAPAPVIQTVAEPPREAPLVIAPPAPPAPPAPAPAPAVARQEVGLVCPGYQNVLQATLSDAFDRVGVPGTVHTLLKVRGGQVVEAVPLSGPKDYYKLVQAATRRMKCSAQGADEVQVTLDVVFQRV
jgi:protein TonB